MEHKVKLAFLILITSQSLLAQIGPAILEANLGPIAIDAYDGVTLNSAAAYPVQNDSACASATYRACIQGVFSSYNAQGVTGVAMQLGMTGAGASTPFTDSPTLQTATSPVFKTGALSAAWVNNLALFFHDLRAANLRRITLRLDMIGGLGGNGGPNNMVIEYCLTSSNQVDICPNGSSSTVFVYPWLPWGLAPFSTNVFDPAGYSNTPSLATGTTRVNQGSWGWGAGSPTITFFDTMLEKAQESGIIVEEIALLDEVDLSSTPVAARLIYDNQTNSNRPNPTPVLTTLGQVMQAHGFSPTGVTFSTAAAEPVYAEVSSQFAYPDEDPTNRLTDCSSMYGDSAILLASSELLSAISGNPFGPLESNGTPLNCNAGFSPGGSARVPVAQPQPTIVDVHNYPCDALLSESHCNPDPGMPTSTKCPQCGMAYASQIIYTDISALLTNRNLNSNTYTVTIGETDPNDPLQCETCSCDPAVDGCDFYPTWPLPTQLNGLLVNLNRCGNTSDPDRCSIWYGGNTPQAAAQDVAGFTASQLYTINSHNGQPVELRPFVPLSNSYVTPPPALGTGPGGPFSVGSCNYTVSGSGNVASSGGQVVLTVATSAVSGTSPQGVCQWSVGPQLPAQEPAGYTSQILPAFTWPNGSNSDVSITSVSPQCVYGPGNPANPMSNCWLTGNGSFTFTVAANAGSSPRSSTIDVAGHPVTITQPAMGSGTVSGNFNDVNGSLLSGLTLTVDGQAFNNLSNPYSLLLSTGQHTVTTSIPAGYSMAGYALQGASRVDAGSATFSVDPGGDSLLWYYLPTSIMLSNLTLSSPKTYEAYSNITAGPSVTVQPGAGITLQVGTSGQIVLTNGFHAGAPGGGSGTSFHAVISNTW
jgi:hypothetical protein